MQNNSPDFFFRKSLFIGNRIDDHVNCNATYGTPTNGEVLVNLQFLNENSQPIQGRKVQIVQNWSGANKKKSTMTINSFGNVTFNIPYHSSVHESRNLEVYIDEADLKYRNQIYLPDFSTDFDVQFFPEGGVLLNNTLQVIAFKAIGTNGLSECVTGKVYSEHGEEISDILTQHSGMGSFLLKPLPGVHYYALIRSERGGERRFDLPQGVDEGVSIHVGNLRENIVYEVTDMRKDTSHPLHMLLHSRGITNLLMPLAKMSGQIQLDNLVPGIYVISILDDAGNTLCERLFFSKSRNPLSVDMTSDKDAYGRREGVDLSFKIHSNHGSSPAGFYSVSITNSRLVRADSLNDTMVSYLLLSSDIKGHIEKPLSYFMCDQVLQTCRLDLLMQTQAWRRYNTTDVACQRFRKAEYYLEVGQTLSGRVSNFFGKPAKNCNVYAIANHIFKATVTDSMGRDAIDLSR